MRIKFVALLAFLFAFFSVAEAYAQLDPSRDIKWPTGSAGCVYAPGSNTCVAPIGGNATEIQGFAVSATSPTNGQTLEYNGSEYVPTTLSSGGSGNISFGVGSPNTSGGTATPSLVQSNSTSNSPLAFTSNVTAGNLLVAVLNGVFGSVSAVSDTLGTSYTEIASEGSGNQSISIWAGVAPSSGANTVTMTNSDSAEGMLIAEFAQGLSTVDQHTVTSGNSSTPSDLSVTTTLLNDLVLLVIGGGAETTTYTPPSGFTEVTHFDSCVLSYAIQSTAGAVSGGYTASESNAWSEMLIAFKANPNGPLPGAEKDIYFDTTSSTFAGYVYHNSAWNPF